MVSSAEQGGTCWSRTGRSMDKKIKCFHCKGKFPVGTMRESAIASLKGKWVCKDTQACLDRVQQRVMR